MNKSLEWLRLVKSLPSPPEQINHVLVAIDSSSSPGINTISEFSSDYEAAYGTVQVTDAKVKIVFRASLIFNILL